jgi:hypothetical protein
MIASVGIGQSVFETNLPYFSGRMGNRSPDVSVMVISPQEGNQTPELTPRECKILVVGKLSERGW